ncbi:hypothetical protein PI125_g13558 [Phytophthora idaei]|nr:hypothetical protein PI125_g13558 [Phytophthora idaei]KAG3147980.1 hypothetical protein PI126_g12649 [Phytophthora idaei]
MVEKPQQQMREVALQLQQTTPSVSDVSMRSAPPSPKNPNVKDEKCRLFDGTDVYPSLASGFEYF